MNIRTVNESDGPLLDDLHVRMYADSPEAFSETLQAARAMSADQWVARAREYSNPARAMAWVAMDGERAVGFMAGFAGQWRNEAMHWGVGNVVTLARAWVDPAWRRHGVGRSLSEAVSAWAHEMGAETLETQVTENNVSAAQFYDALGFVDTGCREPLRSNRSLRICFLTRSLRTDRS